MANRKAHSRDGTSLVVPEGDRRGHPLLSLVTQAGLRYTSGHPLTAVRISRITEDSRQVRPGSLYVAVSGTREDGHAYIPAAVQAGAAAVCASRDYQEACPVPCLLVDDTADALARLSAASSGLQSLQANRKLDVVGVTGTNGKTTTTFLIQHLLQAAGHRAALLGTIRYDLTGRQLPAPWTTPPAGPLAEHLVEAHEHGAEYAVMEVSSHALSQRRTNAVRFQVGVFMNLSGDHLDYHRDAESYLQAKKMLFDGLSEASTAVVNADDPSSERVIADCRAQIRRFGIERQGDVVASDISCDIAGSRFVLHCDGAAVPVHLPLVGVYNVSNALAAATAGLALGLELTLIQRALADSPAVPGRLQRATPADHPLSAFVDYAHTDDALRNVLSTLRPLTPGRLWCVFGCGGDRDRSKRPRMAAICEQFADCPVVTSDNPRTENPHRIIEDILSGFQHLDRKEVRVEADRRRAIELAFAQAASRDVVLIAGKGHEDYQLVGGQRLPFDDLQVVQEVAGVRAGR